MRLEYKDIRTALDNLASVTKGVSGNLYAMLRFVGDDKLSFCYSDGKISYIESVNAVKNANVVEDNLAETPSIKDIVVEIHTFENKFRLYSSSNVQVDAINIVLNEEKNSLELDGRKYYIVKRNEIDGEPCEPYEEKIYGSRIRTSIVYYPTDEKSLKFNSTQADYNNIFTLKDSTDNSEQAENKGWKKLDKAKFISDMNKLTSTEGATVVVIHPDKKKAVAVGRGYSSVIYIGDNGVKGSIGRGNLVTLTSILAKIGKDEEVRCAADGKHLKFVTDDERVGICIEKTQTNIQSISSLVKFESIDNYDNEYLVFNKAILQDMIKGALTVKTKESVTDLLLSSSDTNVVLRALSKSSGSSEESFEVYSTRAKAKGDDLSNYNDKHMRISLINLDNILRNCSGSSVLFSFGHDDEDTTTEENNLIADFLRIGDIVDGAVKGYYYLCI